MFLELRACVCYSLWVPFLIFWLFQKHLGWQEVGGKLSIVGQAFAAPVARLDADGHTEQAKTVPLTRLQAPGSCRQV